MNKELLQQALEGLEDCATLLGRTQAIKGYGYYTEADSRFELFMRQSIAAHRRTLESAIAQPVHRAVPAELCDAQIAAYARREVGHNMTCPYCHDNHDLANCPRWRCIHCNFFGA